MNVSPVEQLKIVLESQGTHLEEQVKNLRQLIKDKAWHDKSYEMTKTEFLAELHYCLGKLSQVNLVLYEMELLSGGEEIK